MSIKNMNFIDLDMEYGVRIYIIRGISNTYPSGAFKVQSLAAEPRVSAIQARTVCRRCIMNSIV
jgi:hypothetical protein